MCAFRRSRGEKESTSDRRQTATNKTLLEVHVAGKALGTAAEPV
jgi:hypothetical protein